MGLDYLDVQYATKKIAALKEMASEINRAGRCFITDGGFHPGLPAALIRYVAPSFDRIETAQVGSVIQIDWRSLPITEATIDEMVEEFSDYQSFAFKDGGWKPANWWSTSSIKYMDFGREFGRRYGMPMFLEELRSVPEMFPTLKEVAFYVGGFNWFVDWLIFPLLTVMIKLAPKRGIRPAGKLMFWGLRNFTKPPYGTMLKVEASGEKDGRPHSVEVTLSHPDGYWFTAIPTVACLLQVLDGSVRKPGLWFQANIVEPVRLMKDMQRMGIEIQESLVS
jgi:saccharopine dehydrogenase (NAD+, L-lysine-forming)